MLSLRDYVVDEIIDYAEKNSKIWVIDCDMGTHTRLAKFKKIYPEKYIEVGIAEQNAIGIAAGIAKCSYISIVSSYASFCVGHAWDQIRHSVIYNKANVKIIGTHAGLSAEEDGATHQCVEDLALMMSLPEIEVFAPMCGEEIKVIMSHIFNTNMPAYVRVGRNKVDEFCIKGYSIKYEIGKLAILRKGDSNLCIIATGEIVYEAIRAEEILKDYGVNVTVMHMGSLRPIDEGDFHEKTKYFNKIITVEEHSITGGLGDIISLKVSEWAKVYRLGMKGFGETGEAAVVRKKNGIDATAICKTVFEICGKEGKF